MKHLICLTAVFAVIFTSAAEAAQRPNILWISTEDISPHLGCYGDEHARTPTLDRLASEGVLYRNAFVTAGVCAPCRSSIITGMYQTTIGTHHMRCRAKLPEHIRCFTEYLREAGYYCTNNSKTDYQFKHPKSAWDESSGKAHWRKRPDKDQPFFAVFNFATTHESRIASDGAYNAAIKNLPQEARVDPNDLTLPPYYPDTPIVRDDWARNYNLIAAMDQQANSLLQQLEEDGLADETIVFFWSDHGVGLPRGKRWLYDSGMHVPLIVRIPEKFRRADQGKPGTITDELISLIDLAPTLLNLAGLPVPEHMQGRAFLGDDLSGPRDYVYGARDRMDERYDIIRGVRDKRYKFIRNYESFKTYYQYMNTPEKGATMKELRRVHAEQKLPAAARLFMADHKPIEELYDLKNDPHEIRNLAESADHREILDRLRAAHLEWVLQTKDIGLIPEPEIVRREGAIGDRYSILRQEGGDQLMQQVRDAASLALAGDRAVSEMTELLGADDASVRYWGAIGLGNLGNDAASANVALNAALEDDSASVRIATARALCRMNQPKKALPVLIRELASSQEWVRLNAAIVLDEIEEQARPAIPALKKALDDKQNKYVVRVANRALNELLDTNNTVP